LLLFSDFSISEDSVATPLRCKDYCKSTNEPVNKRILKIC